MKLTTKRLKTLIKEEMENILEQNPLAGDMGTAAPDGKGGTTFPNKGKVKQVDRDRKIAALKNRYEIKIKDMKKKYPKEKHKELEAVIRSNLEDEIKKLDQPDPFSGDTKTAAKAMDPSDPSDPNNPNNPLGGDRETVTPDNPQGAPIGERVAELEKVVKELIRFIQKGKK